MIPSALEVYTSSAALTSDAASELSSVLSTGQREILARPSVAGYAALGSSGSNEGSDRSYLPVLFSALMPGTGELYLGYKWRGAALIALEVAAWTGYFYYRNQGLDSREAYENFADIHWHQNKWIDDHPLVYPQDLATPAQMDSVGDSYSGSGEWPGYIPWASKEEDKQHYYENIGKYDWYISGWDDYDPDYYTTHGEFMTNTPNRDIYRSMRQESNDQLDTANGFVYLSLGTRVFSIVETLLLVRFSRPDDDAERSGSGSAGISQNQLRIRTRPRGFDGAEIVLEYWFK